MIETSEFDVKNFSNTEIDYDNEFNKTAKQFTCFGRYNYKTKKTPVSGNLTVYSKPFVLSYYGITPKKYEPDDTKRQHITIPYDESQKECVEMFKVFEKLDEWAEQNKEKILGTKLAKFASKYEYSPIVKTPQVIDLDDDDDKASKSKDNKPRPKKAKLKFDVKYGATDINTALYVDDNGVPVKQASKTIADFEKFVTFGSTIRVIFSVSKIWIMKSPMKAGELKKFGLGIKLNQIEVCKKGAGDMKADFESYAFPQRFDDNVNTIEQYVEKEEVVVNTKKTNNVSDEDSDTARNTKAVTSDSDSSEEEEVKSNGKKTQPVVKQPPKVIKDDTESDTEESDSEEERRKAKAKKATTKKAKN